MLNSIFYLTIPLILFFHDFHITHTTLHYNSTLENLEITIKVAIDDLELSLDNQELRIGTTHEHQSSDEIIKNYFKNRLNIYCNNSIIDYQWIGKETSENLHDLYIYFEVKNINEFEKIKSLTLENTIFIESIINQTNIVLIEFEENNYNLTFTKDHSKQMISFN